MDRRWRGGAPRTGRRGRSRSSPGGPAGAGVPGARRLASARCRTSSRRRRLVHGAGDRETRVARPGNGEGTRNRPRGGIGSPRGHRRPRWRAVDHGRRPKRDRASGPEDPRRSPLPPRSSGYANLNTATFDRRGVLWFTGQSGIYGRVDPRQGRVRVFRAPGGSGPYGIATTPSGTVYYASLAGSHVARIDTRTGKATLLRPPTRDQGARRIWADSRGRLWISEWNAGKLGMYDPARRRWREWRLPGRNPQPYAVYVDHRDAVWMSDFGANALVRFDPRTSRFRVVRLPTPGAAVRQLLGRRGKLWGAESGVDKLVVVRTA